MTAQRKAINNLLKLKHQDLIDIFNTLAYDKMLEIYEILHKRNCGGK